METSRLDSANSRKKSTWRPSLAALFAVSIGIGIFFAPFALARPRIAEGFVIPILILLVVLRTRLTKLVRWLMKGAGIPILPRFQKGVERLGRLVGIVLAAILFIGFASENARRHPEFIFALGPSVVAAGYLLGSILVRALFWVVDGFRSDK